jgi:hypothetical protein
MDNWLWILIAIVAVVVVAAVLLMALGRMRRRRHTARLRRQFGPEYDVAVRRLGRTDGERHLESRLHDHEQRRVRAITPEERDAALQSWEAVQTSFVEMPVGAVRAADQLVFGVLQERGYPLETVDDRASALSVENPELAYRYREAQAALARADASDGSEGADVDRLRNALLTYRDLLHELVDAPHVQGRLTTSTTAAAAPAPTAEPVPAAPPAEPAATEAPMTEAHLPSDRTNA